MFCLNQQKRLLISTNDQTLSIATANENGEDMILDTDTAETLLDLITSGQLEILSETSIEEALSLPAVVVQAVESYPDCMPNSLTALEVSWNSEIDSILYMEKPKSPSPKKTSN